MSIDNNFITSIKHIQKDIDEILSKYPFPDNPKYLYKPLKYVLRGKGKRLRPVLLMLAGKALKVEIKELQNAALAVELLHNFTLVHDDIMDNDIMRHGQPTVQKKWDISTSILAGDAIFVESQRLIATINSNSQNIFKRFNDVALDVCVGQAYDKEYEDNDNITLDEYLYMIQKKTGALLSLCVEIPALLSNQDQKSCEQLRQFGYNIGKAFQIQDDLLEIYSDTKSMGKSLGSDVLSKKQTALTIMARNIAPNEWSELNHKLESYPLDEMINMIRSFFDKHNIYSETKSLSDKLFKNGLDNLLVIPEPNREDLIMFTEFLKKREY